MKLTYRPEIDNLKIFAFKNNIFPKIKIISKYL